jgi:Cu/Ag efflux pump CusA
MPSSSSRSRCGPNQVDATARHFSAGLAEGDRIVVRGAGLISKSTLEPSMFKFVVSNSLRSRLFVLAAALAARGLRIVHAILRSTCSRTSTDRLSTSRARRRGSAPQEVEQLVTFPSDRRQNGMPGVIRVRSVSGHRVIRRLRRIRLGRVFIARVAERLTLIRDALPRRVNPQMARWSPSWAKSC